MAERIVVKCLDPSVSVYTAYLDGRLIGHYSNALDARKAAEAQMNAKTNRYIQTTFNPKPGNAGPPSPFRFDWEAIWSDDSSEGRHVGYGATEAEAIDDLKRLDSERAEAEEDARLSEANFPFSGSF